jgi:hypothetical protein
MPSYVISRRDAETVVFSVTLHNEGSVVALDTCWAVVLLPRESDPSATEVFDRKRLASMPILPQRALRPGESVVSSDGPVFDDGLRRSDISGARAVRADFFGADWRIVVRYTDVAGRRWEYVEPKSSEELAPAARIVRDPDW